MLDPDGLLFQSAAKNSMGRFCCVSTWRKALLKVVDSLWSLINKQEEDHGAFRRVFALGFSCVFVW